MSSIAPIGTDFKDLMSSYTKEDLVLYDSEEEETPLLPESGQGNTNRNTNTKLSVRAGSDSSSSSSRGSNSNSSGCNSPISPASSAGTQTTASSTTFTSRSATTASDGSRSSDEFDDAGSDYKGGSDSEEELDQSPMSIGLSQQVQGRPSDEIKHFQQCNYFPTSTVSVNNEDINDDLKSLVGVGAVGSSTQDQFGACQDGGVDAGTIGLLGEQQNQNQNGNGVGEAQSLTTPTGAPSSGNKKKKPKYCPCWLIILLTSVAVFLVVSGVIVAVCCIQGCCLCFGQNQNMDKSMSASAQNSDLMRLKEQNNAVLSQEQKDAVEAQQEQGDLVNNASDSLTQVGNGLQQGSETNLMGLSQEARRRAQIDSRDASLKLQEAKNLVKAKIDPKQTKNYPPKSVISSQEKTQSQVQQQQELEQNQKNTNRTKEEREKLKLLNEQQGKTKKGEKKPTGTKIKHDEKVEVKVEQVGGKGNGNKGTNQNDEPVADPSKQLGVNGTKGKKDLKQGNSTKINPVVVNNNNNPKDEIKNQLQQQTPRKKSKKDQFSSPHKVKGTPSQHNNENESESDPEYFTPPPPKKKIRRTFFKPEDQETVNKHKRKLNFSDDHLKNFHMNDFSKNDHKNHNKDERFKGVTVKHFSLESSDEEDNENQKDNKKGHLQHKKATFITSHKKLFGSDTEEEEHQPQHKLKSQEAVPGGSNPRRRRKVAMEWSSNNSDLQTDNEVENSNSKKKMYRDKQIKRRRADFPETNYNQGPKISKKLRK